MQTIQIYFLLFIIFSCIGWIIETVRISIRTKEFVNRGFLIGPYCPIYGFCSIFMILLLKDISNPLILFTIAMIICSICEYITSYFMEKIFNARWWDYSKYKYNLNGRICLKNTLLFGLLGLMLIYIVYPFFLSLISNMNDYLRDLIFAIFIIIFIVDFITSFNIIIRIKNISYDYVHMDNTKDIANKVKEAIRGSWPYRRIFHAYPELKLTIMDKIHNIKIINPLPIKKFKR